MCCRYPIQILLTSGNGIAYKNNSYAFLTFPCNSVEYPQRLTAYSSVSRLRLSELRNPALYNPAGDSKSIIPASGDFFSICLVSIRLPRFYNETQMRMRVNHTFKAVKPQMTSKVTGQYPHD